MWRFLVASLLALASLGHAVSNSSKPNVLLIMSDDQDMILNSLSYQPNVMNLIGGNGILYEKHYCTVAWCCPSRVNLLTGRAAHNTNVTSLTPPYGGWPKFVTQNLNDNYLPVWINESGIRTYYVGKFLNSYNITNFAKPHPKGWYRSSMLVDPYTYNYFDSHWTDGYTGNITGFNGTHTTNVTQDKALQFLDEAAATGEQFFMMVTPVAPHQASDVSPAGAPPAPPEFEGAFADQIVPRTPNFNPEVPSGASWVYNLPRLNDTVVQEGDYLYYHRLENIAGVDAMVGTLIQRLEDHNLLDNTYILYTSDNGFHISQHRLAPGKRCGYETDINIPLLIRGPGVPKNVTTSMTNSHTDIAPTVLQMLGLPLRPDFDGQPVAYTSSELGNSSKNEYLNVEFWNGVFPGDPDPESQPFYYNNTYKSLRLRADGESFYYSVWCDGSHEFYDMNIDYYQMNNLMRTTNTTSPQQDIQYFGRPVSELYSRLDALLLVLKTCKQGTCRDAYSVLFPNGQVKNMKQAMDATYDSFFASQPKVSFDSCIAGNIISLSGPQDAIAFSG